MSDEHHSAPYSDPVVGHDGTSYEGSDARANLIVWSLLMVAALAIFGFVLTLGIQKYFADTHPIGASESALAPDRVIPPPPQVQVHPWEDLPELNADAKADLESAGRDKAGRLHIPIETAMKDVLPRLKIEPDAPKGLTTPGGQGGEFSHALAPSQGNERPQIEGEIRKHAQ